LSSLFLIIYQSESIFSAVTLYKQNGKHLLFYFGEITTSMEKAIVTTYGGVNSKVKEFFVNRLFPKRYTQAVGPFGFI